MVMVWYGMVGMVWYGMVWYGMVWYGMVWCLSYHNAAPSMRRDALCELCARLLRKKPVRALLAAQRAVLAQLARLMLRSVRAAFGERQQRLKKEEAAKSERELLEATP
jgi:hypothetical protein